MIRLLDPEKEKIPQPRRVLRSDEIFAGSREVFIQHKNDYYRLILTKAGKLILNK